MAVTAPSKIAKWRADPISFVRELFHTEPDPWQKIGLEAFPKNNRIALKACKGPGKTTLLSWFCWNFLATRPHPKIAATSISKDNLDDGLWTEMAKWMNMSPFLKDAFVWTKTRIFAKQHPEDWWMSARTWPKAADKNQQADTLSGLHADYLLFVIDEAGGIPESVSATAEAGLATGIETKLCIAGNPTHLEGPLYKSVTSERALWFVIEITGDPDDPDRAPRISVQWAREQIEKYGKDNPWVLVNVFGKFPPSSINALFGPDAIKEAMRRNIPPDAYEMAQKRLGVDCARFGDDRTIIFPRQGLVAFRPIEMRNARSNEIAARVMLAKSNFGSELELVDGTGGWGSGVIDSMIQAGSAPMEVQFAGKAIDNRYLNKRAEMWFLMAEWIKRGGSLPNDSELVRELTAPTYTFSNGKFQVEPKDMIKKRLGFSPDKGDALALTFALPEMPQSVSLPGIPSDAGRLLHDWDPTDDTRM